MRLPVVLLACAIAAVVPATAKELVLGAAKHDLTDTESGVDFQAWLHFDTPALLRAGFLDRLELTPYVFGSTNSDGQLSYGGAGLEYDVGIAPFGYDTGIDFEYGLGLVVHDGRIELPPPWEPVERQRILDTERTYGCPVLFQNTFGFARDIGEVWGAGVYFEHLSHGKILCDNGKNEGIDSLGLRVRRQF